MGQLQNPRGGRADRRTFPIAVPAEMPPAPGPPPDLKAEGLEVWAAYWSDPVSCAATDVDRYDIARYCRLIDRRAVLERAVRRRPVVKNDYGEQPNPRFKIIRELSREIEKTREQLGILPLARMRLGLVQTQRDLGVEDLRRRLARQAEGGGPQEPEGTIEAEVVVLDDLA